MPPLPSWAAPLALALPNRATLKAHNARLVAAANASDTTFDVVFYGDSLTGLTVLIQENAAVWESYFGSQTGLRAARLGLGGSTVEELAWRVVAGGEKLARDPLVRRRAWFSCAGQRRGGLQGAPSGSAAVWAAAGGHVPLAREPPRAA